MKVYIVFNDDGEALDIEHVFSTEELARGHAARMGCNRVVEDFEVKTEPVAIADRIALTYRGERVDHFGGGHRPAERWENICPEMALHPSPVVWSEAGVVRLRSGPPYVFVSVSGFDHDACRARFEELITEYENKLRLANEKGIGRK